MTRGIALEQKTQNIKNEYFDSGQGADIFLRGSLHGVNDRIKKWLQQSPGAKDEVIIEEKMMTKVTLPSEDKVTGKTQEIFEDIKQVMELPKVPNLFKAMSHHPDILESTWNQFKAIMTPGELSRREKELIAMAVSATNNCEYCIHAHSAALKGMGFSDKGMVELMGVIGLYNYLNKFLDGLHVEPDLGV